MVDASASMAFRGPSAPASKLAFASLLAAALARVALSGGDPVSLTFLGGAKAGPVARSSGREQFDRVVSALEAVEPAGDAHVDGEMVERAIQTLSRMTRRGAIVIVLSDLLDLPGDAASRIAALVPNGRVLAVVQTLDPAEADFPFPGTVRLRSLEGNTVVETEPEVTREGYLKALADLTGRWQEAIVSRGGRFLRVRSADSPAVVVREIVHAVR